MFLFLITELYLICYTDKKSVLFYVIFNVLTTAERVVKVPEIIMDN